MKTRLVIDEDSVYEIDEDCETARKEQERRQSGKRGKRIRHAGPEKEKED